MLERDAVVGTMSAQVARLLGLRITSGEYRPGDTLPIESELCRIYGVSRSTIREAINKLSGKRLLDVGPKVGTRVRRFEDWALLDPELFAWRLASQFDTRIVEDLYEFRTCFEPRASCLAALGGTEEEHHTISRRLHELEASFGRPPSAIDEIGADAEVAFHLAILTATHNGLYVAIGGIVRAGLRAAFALLQRRGQLPREDFSLYAAIVAAILARNGDAGAHAMTRLLDISRQRLLSVLATG